MLCYAIPYFANLLDYGARDDTPIFWLRLGGPGRKRSQIKEPPYQTCGLRRREFQRSHTSVSTRTATTPSKSYIHTVHPPLERRTTVPGAAGGRSDRAMEPLASTTKTTRAPALRAIFLTQMSLDST